MINHRMTNRRIPASLRLCAFAFIFSAPIASQAAEPNTWNFWPFRSVQKSAATSTSTNKQELPPVARPQPAPVQIAPASFQAPLTSSPPKNIEPFPLLPGAPSAYELYRQTNDDVLRKRWGCVNCPQGVRDMHDGE